MGSLIYSKVDNFIQDMNRELASYRKELEKSKDRNGEIPHIKFVHNNNKSSYMRTPKQHVESLINNKSWTFTSRHLSESARHVLLLVDGKLNWEVEKTDTWRPYDLGRVKNIWQRTMEKHDLRNFKGKKGWGGNDPLHLELPNSNPGLNHPKVKKVIQLYIKETRINGRPKNKKLERVKKFQRIIEKFQSRKTNRIK